MNTIEKLRNSSESNLLEEYKTLTSPDVRVFSYEDVDSFKKFFEKKELIKEKADKLHFLIGTEKFSKIIKTYFEDNIPSKNKKKSKNEDIYNVPTTESVYYSPVSNAERSKKYRKIALKMYNNSISSEDEIHHLPLNCSSNNIKYLVALDKETHRKLHEIHDLENKLEVLEAFEKDEFKHKKIFMKGVGTCFKNSIYELQDLNLSNSEIVFLFKGIKNDLIDKIDKSWKDVSEKLEECLKKRNKFSNIIETYIEDKKSYDELSKDDSILVISKTKSIYYSPVSFGKMSEESKNVFLETYHDNISLKKENHYSMFNYFSNNTEHFVPDEETKENIHKIRNLENELEVLEAFEKDKFKNKKILLKGNEINSKNVIYQLTDLNLSEEQFNTFFREIKNSLIYYIDQLSENVSKKLEESLNNTSTKSFVDNIKYSIGYNHCCYY